VKLRAHNLLCIQGFVGKGYSPAFVANMRRIVEELEEEVPVTVVEDPDSICRACPNLEPTGCALHGDGTERGIVAQDREVLRRLGLVAGETLSYAAILERIQTSIRPNDLDQICGSCPWLALGHCREGLRSGNLEGGAGGAARPR